MFVLFSLFFAGGLSQELLDNPRCNHYPERGECSNFDVHWYYDRYDHRCRRFFYGGCGGNENRFATLEECSASCKFRAPTNEDRCLQPHDPGHCNADIERWFFHPQRKQCMCSWWSGCGGNSNIYYSYNHCMNVCGAFAQGGPALDENYWGKKNKTTLSRESQAVFDNHKPPLAVIPNLQHTTPYRGMPAIPGTMSPPIASSPYDDWLEGGVQEIEFPMLEMRSAPETFVVNPNGWRTFVVQPRRPPTLPPPQFHQQPRTGTVRIAHADDAIGEMRTGSNFNDDDDEEIARTMRSPQVHRSRIHTTNPQELAKMVNQQLKGFENVGAWTNYTEADGRKVFRYDSGPVQRTDQSGRSNTNRQVMVIVEQRVPQMNVMQRHPGMVEFAPVTAAPYPHAQQFYSTLPPAIRRRLKKIQRQKIPPRVISRQKITWNGATPTVSMNEVHRSDDHNQQAMPIGQGQQEFVPHRPIDRQAEVTAAPVRVAMPTQRQSMQYPPPWYTGRNNAQRTTPEPTTTTSSTTTTTTTTTTTRPPPPPPAPRTQAPPPPTPRTQAPPTYPPAQPTYLPAQPTNRPVPPTYPPAPTYPPRRVEIQTEVRQEMRNDIRDMTSPRPTHPPAPTYRSAADPIPYYRPIIEEVTSQPKLSIEEIIALGDQNYDEYDADMEVLDEPVPEETQQASRVSINIPPPVQRRPPPPPPTPPQQRFANMIVQPPDGLT